eukprot:gene6963-7749_t
MALTFYMRRISNLMLKYSFQLNGYSTWTRYNSSRSAFSLCTKHRMSAHISTEETAPSSAPSAVHIATTANTSDNNSAIQYRGKTVASKYPSFNSDHDNAKGINNMKFLKHLEKLREDGIYQHAANDFDKFQLQNPAWIQYWPAQKIAATILHMYYKAGLYNPLLKLYSDMINNGFQHGEGIYKTLIKCCIANNYSEKALRYYQILKDQGLRNIRIYSDLIKYFAENKQLGVALELFVEMQSMELNQKTRKQLNDQEMFVLLINSAMKHAKLEQGLSNKVVDSVLCYVRERCLLVGTGLSHVIFEWTNLQSDWLVESLESNITESYEKNDYSESEINHFLKAIESYLKNDDQKKELSSFSKYLEQRSQFDVIVDGANVLFATKFGKKSEQKILQGHNLVQLVQNLDFRNRKILIIIPELIDKQSKFSKSKECKSLLDLSNVDIYWTKEILDDIAVIYAALKSELLKKHPKNAVVMITNDSLRDHIQLASTRQWKFLRWIRNRQMKFLWNVEGEIDVKKVIPHELANRTDTWILTQEDGKILRISRN